MGRQANGLIPLEKLNFYTTDQNLDKSRYQSFLVLSNYAWFSYFLSNILSWIKGKHAANLWL